MGVCVRRANASGVNCCIPVNDCLLEETINNLWITCMFQKQLPPHIRVHLIHMDFSSMAPSTSFCLHALPVVKALCSRAHWPQRAVLFRFGFLAPKCVFVVIRNGRPLLVRHDAACASSFIIATHNFFLYLCRRQFWPWNKRKRISRKRNEIPSWQTMN